MTRGTSPDELSQPPDREAWAGETYFGRQQVKPAPFDPFVVGGYIFFAGLSGASALIGAIIHAQAARGSAKQRRAFERVMRRSRYLSLLAPTIGSALLVYDLHTPQRFYNMLRIAKARSPMSIGTWILMSFSAFAGVAGATQIVADAKPRWRWPRRVAATAQMPAAVAGAGLSTYTAALISATSTPIWAAAPRATAVRFASSSIAAAAGALALGNTPPRVGRALDTLLLAALTAELAAGVAADLQYQWTGVAPGRSGRWGTVEKVGATGLGVLLPIGLLVASRLVERRPGALAQAARATAIAGSATMRVAILGVGAESARRPEVSMRFAQPDNLPDR